MSGTQHFRIGLCGVVLSDQTAGGLCLKRVLSVPDLLGFNRNVNKQPIS